MSDSDDNYESDDDSWCYSIGAMSEPRLISADDDFLNPSLSTSSGRSSPSSSVITDDDDDDEAMDIEEDDEDDTSDTSTPLDETEYEMDDINDVEVVVISDDSDVIVLSDSDGIKGTVTHSQPPTTFNGPMSTLFRCRSTKSKCTDEETAACSQPSPTFNRPTSMLSTFSSTTSTCTEEETVTASESNGEENFSASSIKNYLPPCLSTHKLCFENGIEVDRILGAVVHNTQLLFRVRWRNDKNGGTDYVDAFEMHRRCPHMALQFYNEHYKIKDTEKTDK